MRFRRIGVAFCRACAPRRFRVRANLSVYRWRSVVRRRRARKGAFSSIGVLSSSLAGRALNTVPLPSNAVALQCDDMVVLGREQQDLDTIHAGPGAARRHLRLHLHILGTRYVYRMPKSPHPCANPVCGGIPHRQLDDRAAGAIVLRLQRDNDWLHVPPAVLLRIPYARR